MNRLIAFCLFVAMTGVLLFSQQESRPVPVDVLKQARAVEKRDYQGWVYGHDVRKKTIDCSQFVSAVVRHLIGDRFDEKLDRRINMSDFNKSELAALLEKSDPKIRGIQDALLSRGYGTVVEPAEAQLSDFLQVWVRNKEGEWRGHVGIVAAIRDVPLDMNKLKSETRREVQLYGSHKSTKGITVSPDWWKMDVKDENRRIFVVRILPSALKPELKN